MLPKKNSFVKLILLIIFEQITAFVNKLLLLLFAVFMFSCDGNNTMNLSSAVSEKSVAESKKDTTLGKNNSHQIRISIKGSTTVAPVMEKLISQFEKKNKLYAFHLEAAGSQSGIEELKTQDADIAMTSAIMNENHKFDFHTRKLDFVELYIGGDALAIIVNVNNKAKGLTKEMVKEIFTGNTSQWEVITGLDKHIRIFGRDTTSGTFRYFKEQILNNEPFSANTVTLKNSKDIIDSVRKYQNAIGYVSFAQLNYSVEPLDISFDQGKTFIKLRNEHVENFHYKFVRPLYLYYTADTFIKLKPFIDFIKSDEGKEIIFNEGYIPVSSSLISGKHHSEVQ